MTSPFNMLPFLGTCSFSGGNQERFRAKMPQMNKKPIRLALVKVPWCPECAVDRQQRLGMTRTFHHRSTISKGLLPCQRWWKMKASVTFFWRSLMKRERERELHTYIISDRFHPGWLGNLVRDEKLPTKILRNSFIGRREIRIRLWTRIQCEEICRFLRFLGDLFKIGPRADRYKWSQTYPLNGQKLYMGYINGSPGFKQKTYCTYPSLPKSSKYLVSR